MWIAWACKRICHPCSAEELLDIDVKDDKSNKYLFLCVFLALLSMSAQSDKLLQ
jgi:hypothetical protein